MTQRHTFTMTEEKAALVHKAVNSQMQALKNWAVSATERGEVEYAQNLIKELRQYEELYAAFNTEAWHTVAKHSDKPIETEHCVR